MSLTGGISWFGGPGDPTSGPTTASGAPVSKPGIAVYNQATLGGYWLVQLPNGRQAVFQQTDIGPAPWTGRKFDFTYTALPLVGYSTSNFPTNATITGQYLGKAVPPKYRNLIATSAPIGRAASSSAGSSGLSPSTAPSNYGGLGGWLLKAALTVALVLSGAFLAYTGARGFTGADQSSSAPHRRRQAVAA